MKRNLSFRRDSSTRADYVLVKCGKIALVLRLICTYPVAIIWAEDGNLADLLLLTVVMATSLTVLLAWDKVAAFIVRHPAAVALDIVLGLIIFASANTPGLYIGYLGSTAVLIGLFFPILGQVLLTALLSLGYLLIVSLHSATTDEWGQALTRMVASIVLFGSLTYVGQAMQKLQKQVNLTTERARSAAAEAALGQERSRIARELHDSLVKSLEGISLQAKAMMMSDKAVEEASMINAAATQSIQESRQLLRGLREDSVPPLSESLRKMVDEVGTMHAVTVNLHVDGCLALPLHVRYTAQKIAEEALENAAEHSGADQLECTAECSEGVLRLVVRDSGKGFSNKTERAARNGNHFGLTGMRERAEEVEGHLLVDTGEGRGTEVVLTVPLTEHKEKA